ncbi:hypothetical protein GJ744_001266 [Endocarpon pusillum]|uniref:Uncharacterized protein n=1 Tax=Endocarpon pusillum TaxID=364733 RepID=A0A8H7ADJ1_9EURO|nr:hypothetical protein GJ744_001266 [Endocarpon pusillum]
MTVQQVGEPGTLKGDPLFMQHLNDAFRKASKHTQDKCRGALHFDQKGDIFRLEPIKFHPEIDPLIRTFADGKTYIGVGAWNGSPGHKSDNDQAGSHPSCSRCHNSNTRLRAKQGVAIRISSSLLMTVTPVQINELGVRKPISSRKDLLVRSNPAPVRATQVRQVLMNRKIPMAVQKLMTTRKLMAKTTPPAL